jgi:signal transduction histidine kinase
MNDRREHSGTPKEAPARPSPFVSLVLFVVSMGIMGALRLYVFPHRFIALAWGLPLLLCLWHRDRRLLWALTLGFGVMSTYKALVLRPDARLSIDESEWLMQLASIGVLAAAIHSIVALTERLHEKNEELRRANGLLAAREEEVGRQNEELRSQAEELQQQNEEIQQQSEELEHQAEELRSQAEELRSLNSTLGRRQKMLQTLLESFRGPVADRQVLERICRSLLELIGRDASAAAIVERSGDQVALQAHAGPAVPASDTWAYENSFAALVMSKGRTAYVDDLAARPDLHVLRPREGAFRSVLATPLELSGSPVGTVQIFADIPRQWSSEEFTLIEWVAAQCSLVLETRRLQKELASSNSRLEQQVRERTSELRNLVDELEHFSYSITHDMRAPLRAMQGFAQLIQEQCASSLEPDCRDYLGRIRSAAARMDRLITDALCYSRLGREEMALEVVDTLALLRGIRESYPDFQMPRASVQFPGTMPAVVANPAGLTQCFSNLLANAVKFMEPGRLPRVVVSAELRGDEVRLWFEDNGIGIAPEMLPRMFGMFQRASKEYEGTGIGLALVRKVIERMGGRVGVESEPGKGSRFWLDLRSAP